MFGMKRKSNIEKTDFVYTTIRAKYGEDLARIISDSVDMRDHVLGANPEGTFNWVVPDEVFKKLNKNFKFTLDVCATPDNAKTPKFFTKEANGLVQDWTQDVCWMCPPYGKGLEAWLQKAYDSAQAGAIVVGVVPARPDLAWWDKYIAPTATYKWIRGDISYKGENFTFPLAVVIWWGW